MARRRRASRLNRSAHRDSSRVAIPRMAVPKLNVARLLADHDRRRFHPGGLLRPIGKRWASRLVVAPVRRNKVIARRVGSGIGNLNHIISFRVPKRVSVCIRRKQRREVLFAKRKLSSGRGRSRRRNEWSDVRC